MFTKNDLFRDLEKSGAPRDRVATVHTSLRAIGETEGGGDSVLNVLISYFAAPGSGGILLIPAHTWKNLLTPDQPTLDLTAHETCIGTLPNLATAHPLGHRSLHPTHSVVAFGDGAEEYVACEASADRATPADGALARLRERHGTVLLLGVTNARNTYMHAVEEMLGVSGRHTAEAVDTTIRMPDGRLLHRPIHRHAIGGLSNSYVKYDEAFRARGVMRDFRFGNAPSLILDAAGVYDVMALIRARSGGAEIVRNDEPLRPEWYL